MHHLMTATIRDYDGSVAWEATCPHDGKGADRDCKWGEEARGCLAYLWEHEAHHPSCDDLAVCEDAAERPGVDGWPCWEARPDPCDGFYADDVGHCHPTDGCGLRMQLADLGMEEGVQWSREAEGTPVLGPVPVTLRWDEGICVLTPVREEVASDAA